MVNARLYPTNYKEGAVSVTMIASTFIPQPPRAEKIYTPQRDMKSSTLTRRQELRTRWQERSVGKLIINKKFR